MLSGPASKHSIESKNGAKEVPDHYVFSVALKDGKRYALDLVGPQWGRSRTVQLWDEYVTEIGARTGECSKIGSYADVEEEKEGELRTIRATHGPSTLLLLDQFALLRLAQSSVTRCLNVAVDSWGLRSGESVTAILTEKYDAFLSKAADLVGHIHLTVKHFLEWVKAHGQKAVLNCDPDVFEKYQSAQSEETGNEKVLEGLRIAEDVKKERGTEKVKEGDPNSDECGGERCGQLSGSQCKGLQGFKHFRVADRAFRDALREE